MLRIDPRVAQVWSSPSTLRFGAQRPRVVIDPIDRSQEILIHALTTGTSRLALDALAVQTEVSDARLEELLDVLSPVLQAEPEDLSFGVAVERTLPWPGDSAGIDSAIARAVAAVGASVVTRQNRPALAVVVSAHLVAPHVAGYWLSRDVPLLPVVLGEETVDVGPLVVPGVTACLHCVGCHRSDEDAAWPLIAAQLLAPEVAERVAVDPVAALDAAAMVARAVRAVRRAEPTGIEGMTVSLDGEGEVSRRAWAPHPRCSCRALPENVTSFERPRGAARSAPRRAAADVARG